MEWGLPRGHLQSAHGLTPSLSGHQVRLRTSALDTKPLRMRRWKRRWNDSSLPNTHSKQNPPEFQIAPIRNFWDSWKMCRYTLCSGFTAPRSVLKPMHLTWSSNQLVGKFSARWGRQDHENATAASDGILHWRCSGTHWPRSVKLLYTGPD